MRKSSIFLIGIFVFSLSSCDKPDAVVTEAAIASAHPLATDAGIEILKQGGNAFDAAVAVTAVLAVVEPYSSGIGGGGFWLLHEEATKKDIMIDGRERAPFAATRDMYLDKNGEVLTKASINGPLAAGIPGVPSALEHLAIEYGVLPLSQTLKPAIELAKKGFEVDDLFIKLLKFRSEAIMSSWAASEIFLKDDQTPEIGDVIVQSDLANTLQLIAEKGANGFYQGEVAEKLVSAVRKNGGIWTREDLSSYGIVERKPIIGEFNGMKIVSASPPSSGGVALVEMFNMLEALKFDQKEHSQQIHYLTEAMRRAYRDRAEFLGDTDYVDVPLEKLIAKQYATDFVRDISEDKATKSADLKGFGNPTGKGTDTTHFSIIDKSGNRVAATLSINYPFGSGFVAEGTGVLLNDEMDDFSAKPNTPNVYGLVGGEANAIAPGKRMLSSMSPTFLEMEDRVAVVGTPGGSRIITMVMLAALEFYKNETAERIVNLPRFHHQFLPDKIFFESEAFDADTKKYLIKMGHVLEEKTDTYGNMHIVIKNKKTGRVTAASDKRGLGKSTVLQ